jgi:hypothetical protein
MLRTPGERSARDLRITRSQLVLSGPQLDEFNDFKRGRTKFSPEQIDELEALFATHGPHPTREQRALVAERINVYVSSPFTFDNVAVMASSVSLGLSALQWCSYL